MGMREKLIELLFRCTTKNIKAELHGEKIEVIISLGKIVDHLIANGVTIPVRCKDCKHYMTIHCTCDGCCISDDWYCADGERRTDVEID